MRRQHLYRNIRAGDQLELMLVTAAASLLAVRFYLSITHYPQLGGSNFHIAHMLWGGVLMVGAIFLGLSFIGPRIDRFVAIAGGIGFGVFIDELGKFITRNNDYFYEPTIGIIYAVFMSLYLLTRFLGRSRPLTSKEYQLNALIQLQEAVIDDMDPTEKRRVEKLLREADPKSPITEHLLALLNQVKTVPQADKSLINQLAARIHKLYLRLSKERSTNAVLRWFFAIEAISFVVGISLVIANIADNAFDPFTDGPSYGLVLASLELASAAISAVLVLIGVVRMRASRLIGYEWLRRAILVNIFLTEFFMFSRVQFAALPSFAFNVVLFILLRYAIRQERHYQSGDSA